MFIGKLGARVPNFAPKRNIYWQHKPRIEAFYSMSTPERQQRRRLATIRVSESDAKQLEQESLADMEDSQNGNRSRLSEPESVTMDSKNSVARACSQAVDGLDKLLSSDEPQSQPLRHRSKALRALDSAGRHAAEKLPAEKSVYSSLLC